MRDLAATHDEDWSRHSADIDTDATTPERLRKLRHYLPNASVGRVLDYGCGRGLFTAALSEWGYEAIGFDISKIAIEHAIQHYPGLSFAVGDPSMATPFDTGSFAALWSSEVIEHVYDVHGIFAEYSRLLQPGGRLILTTPYHGWLKNIALVSLAFERHFNVEWQHIRFWTRRSMTTVAAKHGIKPVAWDYIGRVPWLAKSFFVVFERS